MMFVDPHGQAPHPADIISQVADIMTFLSELLGNGDDLALSGQALNGAVFLLADMAQTLENQADAM